MRVSIEMVHERYGRTSVKEQIQLTKVFIASEKENRFNPGWIHPTSFHDALIQLGENSLARGIHAITSFSQTEACLVPRPTFVSSWWITSPLRILRMQYQVGDEIISWRGNNFKWFHSHVLVTVGCAAAP